VLHMLRRINRLPEPWIPHFYCCFASNPVEISYRQTGNVPLRRCELLAFHVEHYPSIFDVREARVAARMQVVGLLSSRIQPRRHSQSLLDGLGWSLQRAIHLGSALKTPIESRRSFGLQPVILHSRNEQKSIRPVLQIWQRATAVFAPLHGGKRPSSSVTRQESQTSWACKSRSEFRETLRHFQSRAERRSLQAAGERMLCIRQNVCGRWSPDRVWR
jgi:hypothetical protein